jgi:ArsR family transcriptional regulator, arsenate/arsenite/antimonite-responsive transcriptional repressor
MKVWNIRSIKSIAISGVIIIFLHMTKYDYDLRNLLGITGALSDETRIRILMMLDIAELCVCQITAALDLAPSTISKHLSILEDADLILRRKESRWVYYRLNKPEFSMVVGNALQFIKGSIGPSESITGDKKKIEALLQEDINITCKRLYHGERAPGNPRGKTNGTRIKA